MIYVECGECKNMGCLGCLGCLLPKQHSVVSGIKDTDDGKWASNTDRWGRFGNELRISDPSSGICDSRSVVCLPSESDVTIPPTPIQKDRKKERRGLLP